MKQRQQRAYDDRNASRTQLFVIMDAEQRREAQRRAALENMAGNAKERAVLARVFEKERKVASEITLSLIKDYSPRPATGQRKQGNEAQGQRPRTTPNMNMGSSHGRAGSRSGPSTPSFPSSPLVRPALAAHSLRVGVVVGGAQRRAALENMAGNAKERAVLARVFEKERKVASEITLSLIKDYSPRPATGQRKQGNEAQGQRPRTTPNMNMGSSHGRAGSRSGPSTPSFPSSPLVRPALAAHSLRVGVVVGGDKWLVKAALESPGSNDGGLLPAGFAESNFGMSGGERRRAPSHCVVVIQRAGFTGDAHRQRCTVPAREVCVRDQHGDVVLDERRVKSFAARMAADAADATMDRSGRPPVSPA